MFRRALVFLALTAVATTGVFGSQDAPEKRVTKQGTVAQAEDAARPEQHKNGSQNVTVVVTQGAPPTNKDQNTYSTDENTEIQRKIAHFTKWLAIIAGIQALILGLTVWAIVRQTSTMRAVERAWVMADVEPDSEKWRDRKLHVLQGSGTSGDSTAIYAVLVCTNAGKTPAWLNEMRAKFEIVKTLPLRPNFETAEHIEMGTIPLGMKEGGAVPYVQRLSWTPIATGHEELGKMAVIYGFVKYRDVFQKRRMTTFAYRITNGQLRRLEDYPKYNDNT